MVFESATETQEPRFGMTPDTPMNDRQQAILQSVMSPTSSRILPQKLNPSVSRKARKNNQQEKVTQPPEDLRRGSRNRKQRLNYDAATGKTGHGNLLKY